MVLEPAGSKADGVFSVFDQAIFGKIWPVNPDYGGYSLLSALRERRSRRFCRGMRLDHGPLAFASRKPPQPLTIAEENLLAFAACGVTGPVAGDLEYAPQRGGSIMAGLIGRTIASGDGIQTVSLAVVNDSGAYFYRRPQDLPQKSVADLVALGQAGQLEAAALGLRVKIGDRRVAPSLEPIFNINANRWSVHQPGTSYFLPINELTFMYINGLLEILNEDTGVFVLDERAGFRPAGVGGFARSKGGHLEDDLRGGRVATVALIERLVTEFVTVEQGMMLQNLGLMTQALGLGGFPNFANHDFAWLQALGFRMRKEPASRFLGVRGVAAVAMKLLGRDVPVPSPIGLEHGGEVLLRTFAPPYFPSMRAAVQAVVETKFGPNGVFRRADGMVPWKDRQTLSNVNTISDRAIAATTAYCEYIWNRYGRFPALMPPLRTVLGFQAGHLDPEFYEKYYPSSALSATQHADFAASATA